MTKKKPSNGLGNALNNAQKARRKDPNYKDSYAHVSEGIAGKEQMQKASCLEQTALDDFITQAELANATFAAVKGRGLVIGEKHIIQARKDLVIGRPDMQDTIIPIPRRPKWNSSITKEELLELENESFLTWRKQLAKIEEDYGCTMTPFERNLDFWRQLWRVVEKSDLIVYIVDARDPLFYRCIDLERYVKEVDPNKKVIILLNKTDYQTEDIRERWVTYFNEQNLDALCFSALKELTKIGEFVPNDEDEAPVLGEGVEGDTSALDVDGLIARLRQLCPESDNQVVGFVGYPNVGKSTVINALFGKKKASMSRQPGKTRHFQTLELEGLTLCDCPGLVFPKVVATKSHLVVNNTMRVDELRNFQGPCQIICDKVGIAEIYKRYGVTYDDKMKKVGDFLTAFAKARGHFLRLGVSDEKWSARRIIRDFVSGRLLHCENPPGWKEESMNTIEERDCEDEEFASDFELEADGNPLIVAKASIVPVKVPNLTKRAQRRDRKCAEMQRKKEETWKSVQLCET